MYWRSISILVVIAVLCFFLVLISSRLSKTLDDYEMITGTVTETNVTTVSAGKGTLDVYAVELDSLDLHFGIKKNQGDLFDYFVDNDPTGEELTIYYDPNGRHVADNLTLHVVQVQSGQEILMSLETSKSSSYFGRVVVISLMIGLTILFVWVLRKERRKNKKSMQ